MGLHRVPDLDSLSLLLEVAERGSLGKVAAARNVSQPAVTARLKAMEGLVGFPLVQRSARGSRLTPAGSLVAEWAREVLEAAQVLGAGIASLRDDAEHRLSVAASLTVAEYLLPRWLVRLAADRPDVTVRLEAMNSAHVEELMARGGADLGFVEGPRAPQDLDSQVVGTDELVLVVPPGHPWTRRRAAVTAEELAATRMVHREPTSGTRMALEDRLSSVAPLASPLLELSTTSAVRSAVMEGAGPAVLSRLAVVDDVRAGRLVHVPVSGVDLGRELRAVWRRGQRPSGPARDLLLIASRRPRAPHPRTSGPKATPTTGADPKDADVQAPASSDHPA